MDKAICGVFFSLLVQLVMKRQKGAAVWDWKWDPAVTGDACWRLVTVCKSVVRRKSHLLFVLLHIDNVMHAEIILNVQGER